MIGVFAGGPSNEREISLESGRAVFQALTQEQCDAVFIDIGEGLTPSQIRGFGIDIAFIALHGRFGEDGTIQKMLEGAGIPYTGSGPAPSRLALDKIASREIFIKHGIAVPQYTVLSRASCDSANVAGSLAGSFGLPLVAKPQYEGSSIGISIVSDERDIPAAIEEALRYGDNVIIEKYIKGRELTVGILNEEPLPVIEVVVREQFYNFNAKYQSDTTEYKVPAPVDAAVYAHAQRIAYQAHSALGCRGFSRVDMRFDDERGAIVVLEVNSIPGLTSHSLLPKAAACAGIGFNRMCLMILEEAAKERAVPAGSYGQTTEKA